ncbi:MAG: alpha-L-arabinofuranosidase C-terminal domain-containing protein, partial [Planctomycetota bacterium]
MKAYDPNIKIIACGADGYDYDWNEALIDSCANLIDYISLHYYEYPVNYKTGPGTYESFIEDLGSYISSSSNPNIKVYMSEWSLLETTDFSSGLYAGGLLNTFMRTGDVFEMGGPALFLRHVSAPEWDNVFINFDHTGWYPSANYVVMKLWRDHYAPKLVETTGGSVDLNVASTVSEDGTTLNIHIVNPDSTDRTVEFEIDSSFVPETANMHYVAPGSLSAENSMAQPNIVQQEAMAIGINGQKLNFIMPGYSVGVITVGSEPPAAGETLYNGIVLPQTWPPSYGSVPYAPMPVPYLDSPPAVVKIDVGRQLFVDDFLIESTTMAQNYHQATMYTGNPVIAPTTILEFHNYSGGMAGPFSGGSWYDPSDSLFKLWYRGGEDATGTYAVEPMLYATSTDGKNWVRPDTNVLTMSPLHHFTCTPSNPSVNDQVTIAAFDQNNQQVDMGSFNGIEIGWEGATPYSIDSSSGITFDGNGGAVFTCTSEMFIVQGCEFSY